jgi:hydrogenase maturation factor
MSVGERDAVLAPGKLPPELLARLIRRYGSEDPAVLIGPGPGRDAAAVAVGDRAVVVKTDPITFATANPAAYLVDVNCNDLACLGATPRWLLVTSLLPEGRTTSATVERQFAELHGACTARGVSLVGGHCEVTLGLDRPILVGTLFGDADPAELLHPGGARPGDRLLLTKALAIEGTALLARELRVRLLDALAPSVLDRAAGLLTDPGISVVPDAQLLLAAGGITALHDPTEGGLAMGVREMAEAAGCGAVLDDAAVPILPETAALASALALDPLGMLASGSLLAAADPGSVAALIEAGERAGIAVTDIGAVTPADGEARFAVRSPSGLLPLPIFVSDEVTRVL